MMGHTEAEDKDKWEKYGGMSPIIKLFESVHPLSDEVKSIINRDTFPISVKKYKFLISPIDRNKNLFFVCKGVVRGYIKEDNKEITTWISAENNVVGSIRNLWGNDYCEEYIQTLENTELIVLPHTMSGYLYANFHEANFVGRVLTERYYRSAEERAFISRLFSAEKRYQRLLATNPEIIERISLKYVASFLGMRLETLSRIRTQNAGKKLPKKIMSM